MNAQSLFSKKNIEAQQLDTTKRGIMEELNFPPEVIAFVRHNARSLQIGIVCVVVLLLCWLSYDYYTKMQEKKGASFLASAMQVEATEEQAWMLENVIKDYSRTDAALWAKIELAHLDYREGRLDAASAKFEEVLGKLSKENPLFPLVGMALAQSYEDASKYDQAISQYNLLKKFPGFKEEAHLALARIYRAKDESAQARKEYEELLQTMEEGADPQLKTRVQAMLVSLGSAPPAATVTQEESK